MVHILNILLLLNNMNPSFIDSKLTFFFWQKNLSLRVKQCPYPETSLPTAFPQTRPKTTMKLFIKFKFGKAASSTQNYIPGSQLNYSQLKR